jgi:hypothetical protein
MAPYPAAAHWEQGGQWADVYVSPRLPLTAPAKPLRAGVAPPPPLP